MSILLTTFGLVLLGLILIALDFIVPSAGIMTVGGLIAMMAGIVFAFGEGMVYGVACVVLSIVGAPAVIFFGLKRLTLSKTLADKSFSGAKDKQHLVGQQGVAITDLRPAGRIEVEREFIDVVAENKLIEKNTAVRVVKVEGNRVVVVAVHG